MPAGPAGYRPPEPELAGAFGIALEVGRRLRTGQAAPGRFDLAERAAALRPGRFPETASPRERGEKK